MPALAAILAAGCFQQLGLQDRADALDFLRSDRHTELLIEIDYVSGFKPADSAVALLEQRASERLNKPGGISVQMEAFSGGDGGDGRWSMDEIRAAENAHRDFRENGKRKVLYVLYLNGNSDQNTADGKVLGVRYSGTSVAIFKQTIREGSSIGPLPFGDVDVERSVLVHEFGHILGLVNLEVPMVKDHEDPEHKGHSSNRASVMYWAIESSAIFSIFGSRPPTNFDSDDIADLKAAGGK